MARRKRGRDIDGVVLLDKPLGCSSNTALQRVRRAFDARKAGHTGSLDPLASGLLPVCLGEATKVSGYLLSAQKHYRVTAIVGAETATGDLEGELTARSEVGAPERGELETRLTAFVGAQQQIPPMYSALKKDGKRLYEHARAGVTVEREPRDIIVHSLELLDCDAASFSLDVRVSSGTYIRTLVEDIARSWGARAHVGRLRRVGVGALGTQHPMTALDDIEARRGDDDALAQLLLPLSTIIGDWPSVQLDANGARAISYGQQVRCAVPASAPDELLCIVDEQERLLGLGCVDDHGLLAPKRLFARPQR
ncbi:tRNA pseudouridine(55) synthase TruB [Salinisphaera aquimarina]|uniref:tRNA pseudouridine synthase B n=1 Tax=Salinisphaera aquimarina TaxID=2094031 RepID=A0ABV7EVY7_9GAMM